MIQSYGVVVYQLHLVLVLVILLIVKCYPYGVVYSMRSSGWQCGCSVVRVGFECYHVIELVDVRFVMV